VFSRERLGAVLAMAPESYKLLFEVLATTGLQVCVRRALVRGRVEPPKTKYGKREVALPDSLVYPLRSHFADAVDQDSTALVFTNRRATSWSTATCSAGTLSRSWRRSTPPGRDSTRSPRFT
jgi:hypothetical protein